MTHLAKVLTVSDSVSAGQSEDQSGPRLASRLEEAGYQVIERRVVSDGIESVASALRELSAGFAGVIVTTGGTGFSPRDLTPEATLLVIEREAPGFGEVMRATHVLGPLSRGRSGTAGQSLIVNTPGSPTGALESLEAILDLLDHALATLHGEVGHHHPPEIGGSTATSSSGPT
jgi:molybdenum cofactor synthesis domain-containing protein